jgi:hypothetical protein
MQGKQNGRLEHSCVGGIVLSVEVDVTRFSVRILIIVVLSISLTFVAGCATNAQSGAAIGGLGGAAIGAVTGGVGGAVLGGAIGAGAGYVIGNEMDK